jgi:hypothetical protein
MKTELVGVVGFLVVAGIAACSGATQISAPPPEIPKFTCLSNSATFRLPADLRATLPLFKLGMPDDAYNSISQSVPGGFAGVFFEDNHYVMTFVDPEKADQARAEIQQAFVNFGVGGTRIDARTAEIRGVRWTIAELAEWDRYILIGIHNNPVSGISSSDIDEHANTLSFGVIDETSRAQLEARLASLGISCNLVTTVIQPYAQAL